VLDRHGLRLGRPVDVHELRQDVAGLVLFEEFLGLLSIHPETPLYSTAAFTDHRAQGLAQVRPEGRIAPDPVVAPARRAARHDQHRDADHQGHDQRPRLQGERREIHIAHLRQHLVNAVTAELKGPILAQHGIDARRMLVG
jgi:hypothetical protein